MSTKSVDLKLMRGKKKELKTEGGQLVQDDGNFEHSSKSIGNSGINLTN